MTLLRSPVAGPAEGAGRLPDAPLPLIGRDAELVDLEQALTAPGARLLTLTGPPGVGKTRLALAAARAVAPRFGDGVVFVDLSPVRDPGLVIAEVARALGLRDTPGGSVAGRVEHALADKELLLVVDNCEQVVAAGPDLSALLGTCAGLLLLVTSRERLYLSAEREVPVPPLTLPRPGDATDPDRLAAVPAVAMLVARVRAVQPDFTLTPSNAESIAEICLRLDGLPLALELAAARAKLFTPGELAVRLRHRMALLTSNTRDAPTRHRTLRAALEWSHELPGPSERALFRRLSVFVGAWTLDAAREVCGDPDLDILETVGSLLDKSLVRRTGFTRPDVAEFVLLESLREYAAELLADHDDRQPTGARHAAHFAALAVAQEARIGLAAEAGWWSGSTASDRANLQPALDHCLAAGDTAATLRLAAALGWHAYFRGHLVAGQAQLRRALTAAADATDPPPDDVLAGALVITGILAWALGELDDAPGLLSRALEISDASGDLRRTAIASSFLGHLARSHGRYDEARARHEHAAVLYQRMPSAPGYAWTRYDLGLLARRQGDLDSAARCLRDGLMLFRGIDYGWAIGRCAWALAVVCLTRSETDEAAALLSEALQRHEDAGDGRGLAQCMEAAAGVTCARSPGRHRTPARRGRGAADPARRTPARRGPGRPSGRRGGRAARAGTRRGRPLPGGRPGRGAIALARSAVADRTSDDTALPVRAPSPFTDRERQVADLVACGRTNRHIARALGIAEKTVEAHVHHVIAKLGAQSRTEVAAWVLTRHHRPLEPCVNPVVRCAISRQGS